MVHAVRLAAAQRLHEGEAERERQGRVQAEHDQRLAKVFAAAPLRVERRVRDAQHLGRQRRVHADRLRDLAHLDVRVLRELDDVARDPRRRREVHERAQVGFDFRRHAALRRAIQGRAGSRARPSCRTWRGIL
jgi:hypothetical protein